MVYYHSFIITLILLLLLLLLSAHSFRGVIHSYKQRNWSNAVLNTEIKNTIDHYKSKHLFHNTSLNIFNT